MDFIYEVVILVNGTPSPPRIWKRIVYSATLDHYHPPPCPHTPTYNSRQNSKQCDTAEYHVPHVLHMYIHTHIHTHIH